MKIAFSDNGRKKRFSKITQISKKHVLAFRNIESSMNFHVTKNLGRLVICWTIIFHMHSLMNILNSILWKMKLFSIFYVLDCSRILISSRSIRKFLWNPRFAGRHWAGVLKEIDCLESFLDGNWLRKKQFPRVFRDREIGPGRCERCFLQANGASHVQAAATITIGQRSIRRGVSCTLLVHSISADRWIHSNLPQRRVRLGHRYSPSVCATPVRRCVRLTSCKSSLPRRRRPVPLRQSPERKVEDCC